MQLPVTNGQWGENELVVAAGVLRSEKRSNRYVVSVYQHVSILVTWQSENLVSRNLTLKNTSEFDVLVIGGGATGSGCALDAVTRGESWRGHM